MTIVFNLSWHKRGSDVRRAFKEPAMHSIFSQFVRRISGFCECKIEGGNYGPATSPAPQGSVVMVCDRGPKSRMFSSEELAVKLRDMQDGGVRKIHIVIGGADGFSEKELSAMKLAILWSFGPMTLPHELAVIVAAEQIYRAWTILGNLPYHKAHA